MKWDCFHIATGIALGCRTFYALDEKAINRGQQLSITSMALGKPTPRTFALFDETGEAIEIRAGDSTPSRKFRPKE
jgi:hypothetical protein